MGVTIAPLKIKKHSHYSEIIGSDNQGKFSIEIQNDCSQIRINSDIDGDFTEQVYIDVNVQELTAIRDFITDVLSAVGQTGT